MATVILNDVAMNAKVGERLLNVARRNAAHIGFVCDNAGTCQTCRCQVLEGADQLSPPSEAERAWIPAARLAEGQRLACQAIVRGHGQIRVVSRAEELRRLFTGVLAPRSGETSLGNLQSLASILARTGLDQLSRWSGNVIDNFTRVGPRRFVFPLLDRQRFSGDVGRVVQRLRTGVERIERPPRVPVARPK